MANRNTLLIIAAAVAVGIIILNNAAYDPTVTGANMVSQNQLSQTEQLEGGYKSMAYPDGSKGGVQLYSIGYGHQLQPGESYPNGISQAQAQQLLLNDMQTVVDAINGAGYQLTQGQFDALADFGYNAGVGALDTALTVFGSQGASGVAGYLPTAYILWHPVPGGAAQTNATNVARRQLELSTWNSGTPIATAPQQAATTPTDGSTSDNSLQWFNSGTPTSLF